MLNSSEHVAAQNMELESSALLDLLEGFETQDGAGRLQQLDMLQANAARTCSLQLLPRCSLFLDTRFTRSDSDQLSVKLLILPGRRVQHGSDQTS